MTVRHKASVLSLLATLASAFQVPITPPKYKKIPISVPLFYTCDVSSAPTPIASVGRNTRISRAVLQKSSRRRGSPPKPSDTNNTPSKRKAAMGRPRRNNTPLQPEQNDQPNTPTAYKIKAQVLDTQRDSIATYMKSMCNHELLKKNEEIILAREIQTLLRYEQILITLEQQLNRRPTYQEWATTINSTMHANELKQQIRRSIRAKTTLTESNVRLVVSIAKRYQNRGLSLQDIAQEGILGLTKACEKFDPERGFRFSTYATWWIKQSTLSAVNNQGRTIRLPENVHQQLIKMRRHQYAIQAELGREANVDELAERMKTTPEKITFWQRASNHAVSMEDPVKSSKDQGRLGGLVLADFMGDPSPQPDVLAGRQLLKDDMSRLLCTLNPRERTVIRMRFGMEGGKPKTVHEVGTFLSVTREEARQIEAKAMQKLRQPHRNRAVKCYVRDL